MLNSDVLEVAIGLVFIFLLLSLIVTSAREGLEALLKQRSKGLEQGLIELFDARAEPQLLQAFYDHPLINALYRGGYAPPTNLPSPTAIAGAVSAARDTVVKRLPSYIPSSSFALAVLGMVAGKQPATTTAASGAALATTPADATATTASAPASTEQMTMADLRAAAANLPPGNFGDAVRLAVKTCDDLAGVQSFLEAWYDAAMDRVSGLYKRNTQGIVFGLSLAICILLNVNTLVIAQALSQNQALRAAIAADATTASKSNAFVNAITANSVSATNAIDTQVDQIERVEGLPIGWGPTASHRLHALFPAGSSPQRMLAGALEVLLGWLITAFAIMLGAPFWFDVLNKIMVVRSTVKPSEKSGDEASKDATGP